MNTIAEVIPLVEPKTKEMVCSFCKATQAQSKKLVRSAVNDHSICDKCIAKALQRVKQGGAA